jgi:hypothetical protein
VLRRNGPIDKPLILLLLIVVCLCGGTYCGSSKQSGGGFGRTEPVLSGAPPPSEETTTLEPPGAAPPPETGGGGGAAAPPPETGGGETTQSETTGPSEETTVLEAPESNPEGEVVVPLPVDRQLTELHGRLSFNTPKQMQMSKPTRIVLVLARTEIPEEKTPKQVTKAVRKRGGTKGKVAGAENVRAAERMRARLTGQDFEIEALDSEVQPLISKGVTAWKWDVTPTEWGKKSLHLSVEALVILPPDRDTPVTVRSYDRDITVTVTMKQRLVAYTSSIPVILWVPVILAILGTIGTALLGWWKGWWSRIRARTGSTPPSGNPPGDGDA